MALREFKVPKVFLYLVGYTSVLPLPFFQSQLLQAQKQEEREGLSGRRPDRSNAILV